MMPNRQRVPDNRGRGVKVSMPISDAPLVTGTQHVGKISQLTHTPAPRPQPVPVMTELQVAKRESSDRIRELLEANNREVERRRAALTALQVILYRSNCEVTRELVRKALDKDEKIAGGDHG